MLDFVTVGTNDLKRAGEFYDAVLGVLGGTRSREGERLIMWSGPAGAALFAVITPFDKNAAAPGNGTMIALAGGGPGDRPGGPREGAGDGRRRRRVTGSPRYRRLLRRLLSGS